ncbi:MAG: hypothetical protein ACI4QM_00310 [Alphaproteobacteria bacterium]
MQIDNSLELDISHIRKLLPYLDKNYQLSVLCAIYDKPSRNVETYLNNLPDKVKFPPIVAKEKQVVSGYQAPPQNHTLSNRLASLQIQKPCLSEPNKQTLSNTALLLNHKNVR